MSTQEWKGALVVGVSGLGGAAALTLASGGVRRIVLVDPAPAEARDLSGHPLLAEEDIGQPRAAAAARRLADRFAGIDVTAPPAAFDERTGPALVASANVVVDASNLFAAMFAVNDVAAEVGRPVVHAGILQYSAQLLTTVFGETGCLRCLFEGPPPPRAGAAPEAEGLALLAGFAGALVGMEALRMLEGGRAAYAGRLLVYEARARRSRSVTVKARPGCPACAAWARAHPAAGGPTA
ncbi:MAG TPA: ThiF family adenylyltransferase [Anaeromyxobacter sp.]|nr:ThiF family adenylyltransferase [Anaeromyxobacter sp.]